MIHALLALLAVIIGVAAYLLWPGAGFGFVWNSAPGGPLAFRVRRGSPLAWLMVLGRTRTNPTTGRPVNNALMALGVIHSRYRWIDLLLLVHEVGHEVHRRTLGLSKVGYLWRYVTSAAFRAEAEPWCNAFAREHQRDPYLVYVHRIISEAQ